MANILLTYSDYPNELNSSIWRVFVPMAAIERAGHPTRAFFFTEADVTRPEVRELVSWANTVVVERVPFLVSDFIDYCKEQGKPVFVTLDDNYDVLFENTTGYKLWEQAKGRNMQLNTDVNLGANPKVELRAALEKVDGLIVPTELLAEHYSQWCKTHVIPNYADLSGRLYYAARRPHDRPVIGWGGSAHRHSWQDSGILPALQELAKKHDFEVWICGKDTAIFDMVAQAIGWDRTKWQPQVVFEHWPAWCAQFDIGVAPLSTHGQDPYRSWVKCLEYGLLNVPWVASNLPPYRDAKGGYLVDNTPEGWFEALNKLLSAPDMREYLAHEGADWAWDLGIDDHVDEYIKVLGLNATT